MEVDMLKLKGVVPPLITPFDQAGNLDLANLEKLLNVREGFDRDDDTFTSTDIQNIHMPIKFRTGDRYLIDWLGRSVTEEDLKQHLDDYYDERGWDIEKGIPTKEKLQKWLHNWYELL